MVTEKLPLVDGVPEITPPVDMERPEGRLEADQL
jgi:hypothetical protein